MTTLSAIRTPEERFEQLPEFPWEPRYVEVDGLRLAHVDEGTGPALVFLHGQPTWSFLFRRLLAPLIERGYRCVALDYAGFGRSDKPTDLSWYSYARHVTLCQEVIERIGLDDVTLVMHDWGGPIGLRMAIDEPERFRRFVLIDAPFFTGRQTMPAVWWQMRRYVEETPDLPIGSLVGLGCHRQLSERAVAAYDAPYPDAESKAGPRSFPLILPLSPELPAAKECWGVLKAMRRDPREALILWGEQDLLLPVELGRWVAGALRRPPPQVLPGAGHFLPEDAGDEAATLIDDWIGARL